MGNQQERLDADLHWLGGILDGEGTFIIGTKRDQLQRIHFVPEIQVGNTSPEMIEELRRILAAWDLPVWVSRREPGASRRTKVLWHLYARGPRRVKRWLSVILPYVRSKRHDALVLLRYVDSRLDGEQRAPYTEEQIRCYEELMERHGSQTNRRRLSSETVRQRVAQQVIGRPRYSPTSAREPERPAEMTGPA